MTALDNDALDERLITTDQLATAALVVVAMAVVATTGFRTVFSSTSFLLQSVIGAALAALVAIAGHRFRLLFGEVVGLALLSPLIVGPLAVGGVGFYRGLATGWAEVLSATPPIDAGPELRALPFIAAFLGSLVGCELERLRYLPGVAIVGPLATLTLTALFTEQTRVGALAIGLVLLIGLLILARLRHAAVTNTGLLVLGLVLGLVSAMASMAGLFLPYADESRRFDLRQLQSPPWDPLSVPSPLTEIKAGLKAAGPDEAPILMVRGDTPATRWRVASLPGYNGIFWGVSASSATSEFVSIDSSLPPIAGEASGGGELQFDVNVIGPVGHWVPVPGVPSRVDFDGPTDARMSLETGTIAIPDQLRAGDSYEIGVRDWTSLSDESLSAVEFVPDGRSAELELLPPVVRNVAADFTTGVDQLSGARVITIRDSLRLGSYDLTQAPGHSFGRVADFLAAVQASGGQRVEADLRPMAGYEELYAATAGVVARLSDVPSRVAVGYVIPEDRWKDRRAEIFPSDISAWLEVYIEGSGWMPIDVTPDRAREPEDLETRSENQGVPVADPPEPPPAAEDDSQIEIEEPEDDLPEPDEEEEDNDETSGIVSIARVAAVSTLVAVAAVALAAGSIVWLKAARRRKRRNHPVPSVQIAGAWAELVDRVDEAGAVLPAQATPSEAARLSRSIEVLAAAELAEGVERLADQVSAAAFHPVPPSSATAAEAWRTYEELEAALAASADRRTRLKRAIDPRPLRDDALVDVR